MKFFKQQIPIIQPPDPIILKFIQETRLTSSGKWETGYYTTKNDKFISSSYSLDEERGRHFFERLLENGGTFSKEIILRQVTI